MHSLCALQYVACRWSCLKELNSLWVSGDLKGKRYFFSYRHGNDGNNNKCKRVAGSGYWKPIGKEKPVLASGCNRVVGMKKAMVFCEKNRSSETNTRWHLHQYRLVGSVATLYSTQVINYRHSLLFSTNNHCSRQQKF